ncbi:MAG TPA: tRNA pseudouridine(55) synthase TruB [Acidimicrobiales bacterium]|nr:tRNA pseudouridine(55) synthase TruB [Acidimicrobiales bacterium]
MSDEPLGLAVLDKPAGMTSHDVVAAVRRALGERRVGHAGTLDPPATGVLLVGVGRATRLLRFLQGTDKDYDGELELGTTTTTLDATGEVTGTFDMAAVTDADVAAAAAALTGDLAQVPPMVSALHVGGRRLHELARAGVEVAREPRRVHVASFIVTPEGRGRYRFQVTCSSGTYVRSLVDDLGRALHGGAHLATLRRTRVGAFSLDDATSLEAFCADRAAARAALLPARAMVAHLGVVTVGDDDAASLVHGRRVVTGARPGDAGEVAVCAEDGSLVGVAARDADGVLRPEVVMHPGGARADG